MHCGASVVLVRRSLASLALHLGRRLLSIGQGFLIGVIDTAIISRHKTGGIGYWIGKPYWNNGYCTEAAQAVIGFGFEVMGLNRISATHFASNPASGRVLQKAGMKYEGCLRQEYKKSSRYEDMVWYGILRSEYTDSDD